MPKSARPVGPIGIHYGKRDMERIGLFAESGWLHGAPYISPHGYEFRAGGTKGRQMMSEGSKTKVGLQDCYFDKGPFKRVFEKEAYSRPDYAASMAASKRNVSNSPFLAGAAGKKHSTPGDFYGTFSGRINAMSRQERARPPHRAEPRNILTNPGKKGTYGFIDITLGKFPKHMSEPYTSFQMASAKQILDGPFISTMHPKPCFNINPWLVKNRRSTYVLRSAAQPKYKGVVWIPPSHPKMQGNNHDGCFGKFPPHKPEKYKDPFRLLQGPKETNVFYPQTRLKSMYTTSVVDSNVDFRINAKNWRTFQPVTYPSNAWSD